MLNITVQNLKECKVDLIPVVLKKASLFSLNNLYNYFTKELEESNVLNSKIYQDNGYENKDTKRHVEFVNSRCMSNISKSEQILFYIKEECYDRKILERFNVEVAV